MFHLDFLFIWLFVCFLSSEAERQRDKWQSFHSLVPSQSVTMARTVLELRAGGQNTPHIHVIQSFHKNQILFPKFFLFINLKRILQERPILVANLIALIDHPQWKIYRKCSDWPVTIIFLLKQRNKLSEFKD